MSEQADGLPGPQERQSVGGWALGRDEEVRCPREAGCPVCASRKLRWRERRARKDRLRFEKLFRRVQSEPWWTLQCES